MPNRVALVAVTLLVLLAGCTGGIVPADPDETDGNASPDEGTNPPNGTLEIHHLDVGQADATLLVEPGGETMLIDTGDWRDDGDAVLAAIADQGVDRIDHLVATHAHADHIGGHAGVIDALETEGDGVGAAYDSGVAHTSLTYERYLDAVETHDVPLYEVRDGDKFSFGDATVQVLNPPAAGGTDLHSNSVSLAITYGETTYLTTGDAEGDAEARMVGAHGDALDADVYQAGHHGSATSSSPAFLDAVDPAVAVISSDYDSQYGHPHDETLAAFADRNIETYWTGIHGDVLVKMDGESVSVVPESEGPTDAEAVLEATPDDADDSTGRLVGPGLPPAAVGSTIAAVGTPVAFLPPGAVR